MSTNKNAPIGIFDSGIGGLTVAKSVARTLPNEDIIYFGDTARVPYGIKSEETVREYALEITDFLISKGVKMILIACNTVSASAKKEIIARTNTLPVLDVITSGTATALAHSSSDHIGVIGTLATVNSKAYEHSIHKLNSDIEVTQQACPLLVPLAEEGWIDNEVATKTLESYLSVFKDSEIDSLILGCTHYPLFKEMIPKVLDSKTIKIIDSADSIAKTAEQTLYELNLLNDKGGKFECYVSDRPQRFQELAERFLGRKIEDVVVTHL